MWREPVRRGIAPKAYESCHFLHARLLCKHQVPCIKTREGAVCLEDTPSLLCSNCKPVSCEISMGSQGIQWAKRECF